jgi:hypothetical protein
MARRPGSSIGAGKIVLIVLGAVSLLFGLALAAAGGVVLFAQSAFRDAQGFFVSGSHPFTSTGYAVTSQRLDLGVNPERGAFQIGGIFTLRLRVVGEGANEIFVGVGPSPDVDTYLARSAHDQVTDVQLDPYQATYRTLSGDTPPGPPSAQPFWAVKEAGTTEQTLIWQPRSGRWTVVIMNADGSRPVNAQMSVGVRVRFLTWIAIGLLIAALVAFIAGGLMLYFGVRAPKVLVTDVPSDPVLTSSSTRMR